MYLMLSERLSGLIPKESLSPALTFPLQNERDEKGHHINGDAYWVALQKKGIVASEGKLFLPTPERDRSHLVLLTPGMPGEGFCAFVEGRFVNPLLQEGMSCLVLRHLGTWTDTTDAHAYIACPERQKRGRHRGKHTIGRESAYDVRDLVSEVTEALRALGPSFDRITLIGHSSGALGEALALHEVPANIQEKIRHFMSLAGLVGGVEGLRWWLRHKIALTAYFWACQKFLHLCSPDTNIRKLREMFSDLYQRKLPAHVMPIAIHAPGDELVSPISSEKFHAYNGRGLYVIDKTEKSFYHCLKNLRAETLLRLLAIYHPQACHTVTFRQTEPPHHCTQQ